MAITTSRKKFNYFRLVFNLIVMIFICVLTIEGFKNGFYIFSCILGLISLVFVIYFIYFILGIISANKRISDDFKKITDKNPYIYFRELPNNYGVGIATVLLNSTIENEKDIVAAVLDLCAKGYLHLEKNIDGTYTITVLKLIDSKLLANERYIMENILNGNMNKLNYKEWLDRCTKDGIELGLFVKRKKKIACYNKKNELNNKKTKWYILVSFVITILISVPLLFVNFNYLNLNDLLYLAINLIMLNLSIVLTMLAIPFYLIPFIMKTLNITNSYSYNAIISGYLKHTKQGEKEVHKLYSFKSFIDDFGAFASKNPEEVVLWDYYLGYAQVFGLTDKILKTGYDKIIRNGSFQIDNINAISLKNIKVNLNKN